MFPRFPLAIAVTGFICAGLASATLPAQAQPADQAQEQAHHHFKPSPEDRAAFLDARLAALHAGLELTADQDKLWPPVEQALRDFNKVIASQRKAFREQRKGLDPIARLQLRSDNLVARGEALKKVATASGPLYAALNDAQKHRLPILLRAIHPHHRFARLAWRHGGRGVGHRPDQGPAEDHNGGDESK